MITKTSSRETRQRIEGYARGIPADVKLAFIDDGPVLDIVVADFGDDQAVVMLGGGDGTFGQPLGIPCGDGPWSVAVEDLNGDQVADLALANHWDGNLALLFGSGGGGFGAPVSIPSGDRPVTVVVGDLNEDQIPELVAGNSEDRNVGVLRGLGGGSFAAPVYYDADGRTKRVVVDDVDGDEHQDLLVVGELGFRVYPGDGSGTFGGPMPMPFVAGQDVVCDDLDGDAVTDVALPVYGRGNGFSHDVSTLLGARGSTAVADEVMVAVATPPSRVRLVPNPVTGAAVRIDLVPTDQVDRWVEIFDVHGRLIWRHLPTGGGSGPESIHWDGRDLGGRPTGAGVFFVRTGPAGSPAVKLTRLR